MSLQLLKLRTGFESFHFTASRSKHLLARGDINEIELTCKREAAQHSLAVFFRTRNA
jgi:hypothetical protein